MSAASVSPPTSCPQHPPTRRPSSSKGPDAGPREHHWTARLTDCSPLDKHAHRCICPYRTVVHGEGNARWCPTSPSVFSSLSLNPGAYLAYVIGILKAIADHHLERCIWHIGGKRKGGVYACECVCVCGDGGKACCLLERRTGNGTRKKETKCVCVS